MSRISDIRDRLAKATPAPWAIETNDMVCGYVYSDDEFGSAICNCNMTGAGRRDINAINNADFIANAPSDIAFLLEQLEQNAEGYKIAEALSKQVSELQNEIEQKDAQILVMRNCDNCTKRCIRGPVGTELDVLDKSDDCKINGLNRWQMREG